MRNQTHSLGLGAALVLAAALLGCSGADPSASGDNAGGAGPAGSGAPPSQDLASATAGGGGGASSASPDGGATGSSGGASGGGASGGGASSSSGGASSSSGGASSSGGGGSSSGGASSSSGSGGAVDPNAGAGPKPASSCPVSKDSAGFFTRTSSKSSYVAYVPASYDGTKPTRLIVGVHGCGDTAYNFATWGVNPYDTRATQDHLGISIGGQDGSCWSAADDAKILAAVDDLSTCFWVHQKKVVLAGFSSGGELAYRLGLTQASRFAGILIEDSGLYAANGSPAALLAGAAWMINIAHLAHTSDTVFPLATVQADWAKTTAAGFPLATTVVPGAHDGTSADWATWLIPRSAAWTAP